MLNNNSNTDIKEVQKPNSNNMPKDANNVDQKAPSLKADSAVNNEIPQKASKSVDKTVILEKLKEYSIAITSIVISFMLIFVILIPQVKAYKEVSSQILSKNDHLSKVTSYAEYLESLKDLSSQLDQNIAISEQSIPVTDEVPFLQNMLLQIAEDSTVDVKSLALAGFVEPTEDAQLGEVKTQVSLAGSYDNLLNYVKKLEKSRRLISVGDVNITRGGEENTFDYALNLQTTAYYMPKLDLSNVSLDINVTKPKLEPVLDKLLTMDEYKLREIDIEIGKKDLFSGEEKTETTETTNTDTNTGSTTGTNTETAE